MISGCRDNQTSSDAYNINNSEEYSGADEGFIICIEPVSIYYYLLASAERDAQIFENRNLTRFHKYVILC